MLRLQSIVDSLQLIWYRITEFGFGDDLQEIHLVPVMSARLLVI